jgi:lysophosphatidylcholine acyltransferase/lyso-PAF acetyltransferase
MDIMCHMYRQEPSHVSKAGVYDIPFVGPIAAGVGCLFINRGSKDERKDLLEQISDRQLKCEQGLFPPLILYPEGGTTNGTHLINFKKGAFIGLRSIQPIIIQYESPFITIENCVYNFFA